MRLLQEPLDLTADLADIDLVESGLDVAADCAGGDGGVRAGGCGHHVLGDELGDLAGVARQRQELGCFAGNFFVRQSRCMVLRALLAS